MNQELLDYIKQQLEAGESKEEILKTLQNEGWGSEDIETVFQSLKNTIPVTNTVDKQRSGKFSIGWLLAIFSVVFVIVGYFFVSWLNYNTTFFLGEPHAFIGSSTLQYLSDNEMSKLRKIGGGTSRYEMSDSGVYYSINLNCGFLGCGRPSYAYIQEADLATFQVLNIRSSYAKDKNNVYCFEKIIPNADPVTFQVVGDGRKSYTKDKNNIYFVCDIIEGADVNTFQLIAGAYAKDKNNVYYFDDILQGADSTTFQAVSGEDNYFKGYYFKDKNSVYYEDKALQNSDPDTFQEVGQSGCPHRINSMYTKDKNQVYINDDIISDINAETFVAIGIGKNYFKDKDNVYWGTKILLEADAETFQSVDGMYCAIDKNYVYSRGKKIEDADPAKATPSKCY